MIVRWGVDKLAEVLGLLKVERPILITEALFKDVNLPILRRFAGTQPHADVSGVREALKAAEGADVLVALGGGSVIDTTKAVAVQLDLPIVSIPTTYSGAEWTTFFGNRDAASGTKPAGTGARMEGAIYDESLTMGLPPQATCGTALNALAHAAEALYAPGRNVDFDAHGLAGARMIAVHLPVVMKDPSDRWARRGLLEGSMHAGAALRAGMGLAHGIAQVIGGKYGLPHGPVNALSLPPTLRYNADVAGDAIRRLGDAMGTDDPAGLSTALGALGCPTGLRAFDTIPEADLPKLAEMIAERPATRANPRPAPPEAILGVLKEMW